MNRFLRMPLKYLNSRRVAAYVLGVVVISLTLSGFLPSEVSMSTQEWEMLARERPLLFRISSLFSTPRVVRSLPFLAVSVFLFLSTVVCTVNRLRVWLRFKASEFERETAFSFEKTSTSMVVPDRVLNQIIARLGRERWKVVSGEGTEGAGFTAHRGGDIGFWGSIVFHLGLLICFLAIPVSAATVFRGQFLATNGIPTPLKEGLIYTEGAPLATVPDSPITIRDLEGTFAEGLYKVDFRAVIEMEGQRYPVAVNQPANIRGLQFTLHEFGYSPNVVIGRNGDKIFDYYLNLRHGSEGDLFDMPSQELTLSIVLMPDFFREGNTIGSRSNNPSNPVLLVRFFRESMEVGKGLVPLGEEAQIEGYDVEFQDLSRWANFIIVREKGLPILFLGMLAGVLGLLVRFLSNERILEFRVQPREEGGTLIWVSGYSKYYPAFLEREVTEMTEIIEAMGT